VRRSLQKTVSMETLERCGARNHHATAEIRTPVQSLAAHLKVTRQTDGASFDMKYGVTEST
jgi:hypothetical protein